MEWVGGKKVGWALGAGGKPKVGNTIHKEANSSAISSVDTETATVNLVGQNSCQQQFDTPSMPPISAPTDSVVDRRGFIGLAKDHL